MLYVDDIALYGTAPAIAGAPAGGDPSLVAHWKLDETEGLDVMAYTAIDGRHRMPVRLTRRRNTMTGIAPVTDNLRAGMVGVGIGKISRVMAQFAFSG